MENVLRKIFEKTGIQKPDFAEYGYILERQLKPEARKDIIEILNGIGITPTSMIDISDGLSSELLHICKASNVGCNVYQEKIPINKETVQMSEEFNLPPLTAALNGGEDYELLFTVPFSDYEKIIVHPEISIIGHIVNKDYGSHLILDSGDEIEVSAQGWNAMKN